MWANNSWYDHLRPQAPAAGQPAIISVPGETWFTVEFLRFTFTASGAVANRFIAVDIIDGDNLLQFRAPSGNAVTAGAARGFTAFPEAGGDFLSAGGDEILPMTHTAIPPGFKIRVTAVAIDVADQISSIFLYVCRLPSGIWVPSPGSNPYAQ